MSRINPRLFYWIAAVYDRRDLTPAWRDILVCLAVKRLDYGDGTGYCSETTLAELTGRDERTIRRALDQARIGTPPLLARTRRGHRSGDGQVLASEWALIYPAMPVDNGFSTGHQSPVEAMSTGQDTHLNRTGHASQPDSRHPPTGIEVISGIEDPSGSETRRSALTRLRTIDPSVTQEEALAVLDELASRPAVRNPLKVLGAEIQNRNGWALIERARHHARKADLAQLDDFPDPFAAVTSSAYRPWCGQCSEKSRHVELDDGRIARCPRCHFLITNSIFSARWSAVLGNGQALVCGTAEDMRAMAVLLDLDAELRHIGLHSSHDGEHGYDPAGHQDDEG